MTRVVPSRKRLLRLILAVVVGAASPASAQDSEPSPHGDIAIPCSTCHTSEGWRPAWIRKDFRHSPSRFPLENAHGAVTCNACHISLEFRRIERTCAACHVDLHRGELGVDCAQCHTTAAFDDRSTSYRAHALSRLPLEGAHRAIDCRSCHGAAAGGGGGGVLAFRGVPSECVACHRAEYARTADPDHVSAGYSTVCSVCHAPATWRGAVFDHRGSRFPLTGAHLAVPCQQCHVDNLYAGTPTACVSCHQAEYTQTTAPGHQALGFSTDCASCHTTLTWLGARFDHDGPYFPIYSGKHANRWSTCTTCHANPASYAEFTCFSCHEHNQIKMNDTHKDEAGYQYLSQACYSCHPRGD